MEQATRDYAASHADVPALRVAHAFLLAEIGRVDEASAALGAFDEDALDRLHDRNWPASWFQLARAASIVGDRSMAARLLEPRHRPDERCVQVSLATVCLGATDLATAWLLHTVGELDAADAHYRAAEELNARIGAGWTWLAAGAGGSRPPVARTHGRCHPRRRRSGATGAVWEVAFAGTSAQLADARGLRDLAYLLARPGEAVSVLELAGDTPGRARRRRARRAGPPRDPRPVARARRGRSRRRSGRRRRAGGAGAGTTPGAGGGGGSRLRPRRPRPPDRRSRRAGPQDRLHPHPPDDCVGRGARIPSWVATSSGRSTPAPGAPTGRPSRSSGEPKRRGFAPLASLAPIAARLPGGRSVGPPLRSGGPRRVTTRECRAVGRDDNRRSPTRSSSSSRFAGDFGAALHASTVVIGDKLGLYRALAGARPDRRRRPRGGDRLRSAPRPGVARRAVRLGLLPLQRPDRHVLAEP